MLKMSTKLNCHTSYCNKIIIPIYNPTFILALIVSLLPQDLWPLELIDWWVKVRDHHQLSHVTFWLRGQVITWQMKNIFPLSQGLWLAKLTRRCLLSTKSYSPFTRWSSDHLGSHDKQQTLYLHFHEACGYQIWQNSHLW